MPVATLSRQQTVTVKGQLSVRLGEEDKKRLEALCARFGLSQGNMIAMLLRNECVRLAQTEGFDWKKRKL